ncbi:MAG TPA: MFS transporter [Candidatus Dormibacteraeota bacterium]|nr:MFS transporter [Candidatus Dormibacteraeota bacterium]
MREGVGGGLLRQPRAVWATAFAACVAFMGIGLVDPILPTIARGLRASAWEVELLFTTYIAVMAGAMFVTGAIATRYGARRTMLAGLLVVVVFASLSGLSNSITMLAAVRGGWGFGNALFTATALSIIVGAASGGLGNAITLYEAALGLGVSCGPLLGAALGSMSWRYPFFGTATLMAIAFVFTSTVVRDTGPPEQRRSAADTFRALRHPALFALALGGLLYAFGFFIVLAYTPLLLRMSPRDLGLIFACWGVLVAVFSVLVAPWLRARLGPMAVVLAVLVLLTADLLLMALAARPLVIAGVIVSGALLGINNALFTSLAMEVSPFTRSIASAGYNLLRWAGAAVAPVLAGVLAEHLSPRSPFLLAAVAVAASALFLLMRRQRVVEGLRSRPEAA